MGASTLRIESGEDFEETVATKLKTARLATGMSTRRVAELISKRYAVSHATIANYELGKSIPPIHILALLAQLYDRPLNWFLERGASLVAIRYRNLKSRTKAADIHRFEATVQLWLDAYSSVERRLGKDGLSAADRFEVAPDLDPEALSREVRSRFGISVEEPIASVVEILENFGVRVLEQTTNLRLDGLVASYSGRHVVVLNPAVSNDQARLNAGCELAHFLYRDFENEQTADSEIERRAYDFASHLLLPNNQLKNAFTGKSMVRLVHFKEKFGISLAAMIDRATKRGFLTKSESKSLWVEFARRGWKDREPGQVRPDRATRFEQLMDEALASGKVSLKELSDLAGVRAEAIRERLNLAMGLLIDKTFEDDEVETIRFSPVTDG